MSLRLQSWAHPEGSTKESSPGELATEEPRLLPEVPPERGEAPLGLPPPTPSHQFPSGPLIGPTKMAVSGQGSLGNVVIGERVRADEGAVTDVLETEVGPPKFMC